MLMVACKLTGRPPGAAAQPAAAPPGLPPHWAGGEGAAAARLPIGRPGAAACRQRSADWGGFMRGPAVGGGYR